MLIDLKGVSADGDASSEWVDVMFELLDHAHGIEKIRSFRLEVYLKNQHSQDNLYSAYSLWTKLHYS